VAGSKPPGKATLALDESHTTAVGEKFFTYIAQTIMDGEATPYYEVRIGGKC